MIEHAYAVIMAGGGGTRLWPLSRVTHPKQTLSFGRPRTLFQMAVDRLETLLPPEKILVVTVAEQAKLLQEQVPAIPAGELPDRANAARNGLRGGAGCGGAPAA